MEKSIKEISLEITKLNEELKGLESFLENAIISAIDEYVKRQKIIRINESQIESYLPCVAYLRFVDEGLHFQQLVFEQLLAMLSLHLALRRQN